MSWSCYCLLIDTVLSKPLAKSCGRSIVSTLLWNCVQVHGRLCSDNGVLDTFAPAIGTSLLAGGTHDVAIRMLVVGKRISQCICDRIYPVVWNIILH